MILNESSQPISLTVKNTGDRPIQVGSHFHFFEVNRALSFLRARALGMRLNIPSGTAVRFEPGQSHDVQLIPFSGCGTIYGFNGLVSGKLSVKGTKEAALERLKAFNHDG